MRDLDAGRVIDDELGNDFYADIAWDECRKDQSKTDFKHCEKCKVRFKCFTMGKPNKPYREFKTYRIYD